MIRESAAGRLGQQTAVAFQLAAFFKVNFADPFLVTEVFDLLAKRFPEIHGT